MKYMVRIKGFLDYSSHGFIKVQISVIKTYTESLHVLPAQQTTEMVLNVLGGEKNPYEAFRKEGIRKISGNPVILVVTRME